MRYSFASILLVAATATLAAGPPEPAASDTSRGQSDGQYGRHKAKGAVAEGRHVPPTRVHQEASPTLGAMQDPSTGAVLGNSMEVMLKDARQNRNGARKDVAAANAGAASSPGKKNSSTKP